MMEFMAGHWYQTIVFYIGCFDAISVTLLGLSGAFISLFGLDSKKFLDRVLPAAMAMVLSNIGAIAIMAVTHWIVG